MSAPLPPADVVHVYHAPVGPEPDASTLSPTELARAERLSPAPRASFIASRALLRAALSRSFPADPAEWRIAYDALGRPEIAHPAEARWIRFSVARARHRVACAIARARDVGVDVEDVARAGPTLDVAHAFFARGEIDDIDAAADPWSARRRMVEYWALKESYLKARGVGLSMRLDACAFTRRGGPIALRAVGDADAWHFGLYAIDARHVVAVAVRRSEGARPVEVRHDAP